MPEGWRARARPHDHRVHRSPHEAAACEFRPDRKHFRYLPPYPEVRRKCGKGGSKVPVDTEGYESSEEEREVRDEDVVAEEDDASSVLSSVRSSVVGSPLGGIFDASESMSVSRHSTPEPAVAPETVYPTPFSQPAQGEVHTTPFPAATPASLTGDEISVHMANTRLRSRLNSVAAADTSSSTHSIISSTLLAIPDAEGALPGPPHHSIEVDRLSPIVLIPATETPPPRNNTRALSDLRRRNGDLVEELRDQTFISARLQTRNRIHLANSTAQQRYLHNVEAELQLAHNQLDAAQIQAERERGDAVTSRRICKCAVAGLLVLLVGYVAWWWVNWVEYEYVGKRLREFYGLEE